MNLMFNVHLRINDAATGKPTPVRLRIVDGQGRTYPPLGRLAEFAIGRNEDVGGHLAPGRERWCYIDGACEVPLPAGVPLVVEATKGPEFRPLRHEVTLLRGQMALRLTIERIADHRGEGWYAGDMRCHFLSPHAALLEGRAEGLDVVQLLAAETRVPSQDGTAYLAVPNMIAFSGQQSALERDGCHVAVNTLNSHPILGTLALLHCHREVYPLSFGGADATDDWSLADWCDQCHRKKGLVVWVDAFRPDALVMPEALADLILGHIDAVECTPNSIRVREWYRAWNAGIRFPLVAASGKDSNRIALGAMRTYAKLQPDEELTLATWTEAIRSGRTVASNGPWLRVTVNGREPGSFIELERPGRVAVDVQADHGRHAELVIGGKIMPFVGSLQTDIDISGPTWLAARCDAFAHTSPIFTRVDGRLPSDAAARARFDAALGGTVDWIDQHGRFEMPRRKEQMLATIEQARQWLRVR